MKNTDRIAEEQEDWDVVISADRFNTGTFFREIWRYRDLLVLFTKRNLTAVYKQTILGPLWLVIQPVLTTLAFTVIFGNIAGISTDGYPRLLFYLSGVTLWTYFADCVNRTSGTFISNSGVFTKVYFPRIISPLAVVLSGMFRFLVQFLLFLGVLFYFMFTGANVHPNMYLLLTPVLLLLMAGLGLSIGIIASSLTTRYRDLQFLVGFGVQLLMYLAPVVYPLSLAGGSKMALLLKLNPMTGIIETFRYAFLGSAEPFHHWGMLGYSAGFMIVSLMIGVYMFNRAQRTFADTV